MQYLAIEGLNRYGQYSLARDIARRWIAENLEFYRGHRILVEKYDIEDKPSKGRGGRGGEYPLQAGFGWTNGVLVQLLAQYPQFSTPLVHQSQKFHSDHAP